MRQAVLDCCVCLRLGRQAEAGSLLMPLLETVTERLPGLDESSATPVRESLARALQCQQSQDLIGLADELEFLLLPLLDP